MNLKRYYQSEKGLVALMMTVVLSILFLLVAYGMALFSLGEERRATDADQSTRAYYAAESEVEASLLAIKNIINGGGSIIGYGSNNCAPSPILAFATQDLAITCKIVTVDQTDSQVDLKKDKLQQYDLTAQGLSRLHISWWQEGTDTPTASGTLGAPPVIELIGASYDDASGSINSATIDVNNLILKSDANAAHCTGGTPATVNIISAPASQPIVVPCTNLYGTGVYHYEADINGFTPNKRWVINVKSRQKSAHFMLEAYNSAGGKITLPDQILTIDVTAKSGNTVYRRIVKKLNIRSGVFSGLDTVIFSNRDVCKNLSVQQLAGIATDNCP